MKKLFKFLLTLLIGYSVIFSLIGTVFFVAIFIMVAEPVIKVVMLEKHNPAKTSFMMQYQVQNGSINNSLLNTHHVFIPIDSISPNLINAVLAAEDDGFYVHPGFDLNAMLNAYEYNRSNNKIKRGASTITQQLAKNLFLSSAKNYSRKYKELGYTLLLEHFLGKKRILELYLNYVQFGKNIFGCETAAQKYFKKSSKNLSIREASQLAAILASPNKLNPLNSESHFMRQRMAVIANNMYLHKKVNAQSYTDITGMPAPVESTGVGVVLDEDAKNIVDSNFSNDKLLIN